MSAPTTEPRTETEGGRRPGRRRRLWRWCAVGAGAILLGAVLGLDWWAPAAAEAWLGGATHADRGTQWGRSVIWNEIVWEGDGVRFTAETLRIGAPSRLLRGVKAEAEATGWTVEISARAGAENDEMQGGSAAWERVAPAMRKLGHELNRRVGEVRLRNGLLRVAGEAIAVDDLWLKGGVVSATLRARGQTLQVESDLELGAFWGEWAEGGLSYHVELWEDRGRAEFAWAGNTARAEAGFSPGEWLPAEWRVAGSEWRVPLERLGLGVTAYEGLSGDFSVHGEGATFAVEANAEARPKSGDLPPLRVALAGGGDANGVRVERLELEAPQAKARLSAPVAWRRKAGWSADGEPSFVWSADLAALSGGSVRGLTEGSARWVQGGGRGARVLWEARGTGLTWRHIAEATLSLRGETDAETSTLTEAILAAGQATRVEAGGRLHHATRTLEGGVFRAESDGAAFAPWLPEEVRLGRVELNLRGAGVWPGLRLDGEFQANGIEGSGWLADTLEGKFSGTPGERLGGEAIARNNAARIAARGEWTPAAIHVGELSIRRSDGAELRASRPVRVDLGPGGRGLEANLAGSGAARLDVRWTEGPGAAAVVRVEELGTEWLQDWRSARDLPAIRLRRLTAEGRLTPDGMVEGDADLDAVWTTPAGEMWARAAGKLGREGATLARLEGGRGDAVLLSGAGKIPWRVLGLGERLEPVPDGTWDLELESRAGADWWDELAKAANIGLEGPELSVRAEGAATTPRATLALGAKRLVLGGDELPAGGVELRALRSEATLASGEITLKRLEAMVDGQEMAATGRMTFENEDWERLRERPLAWVLDHAEAHVSVPGAEVAAIARYLPTLLAPQGLLKADLRLSPGAKLDGTLELQGAATRPLGGFGVLQDVEVTLSLSGHEVRIDRMRAVAGGQELQVTGRARREVGRMPALDLAVKAERFPLVRKPGLLLRGDLDLTVKTAGDGRTRLGGEVRLRESLFLADIRSFVVPSGGRGAAAALARPPYFSVENPPLADWELALRVGGRAFLRLRTPVFEGVGSARFDLTGTLREPRAVGEFWVERGNILFPFASFAVREGAVRLRASDPYTPALDFHATARRLGYDLRLELDGTADAPQLQLTSSPPLEAETVLLMVTAGAAPGQGTGAASGTRRFAAVGAYVGRDLLRSLGVGGTDEERLTLSSGEKVSRAGRETYGFEFKLNDWWALTGEYDEFDAYNVGVKRRFGPGVREEAANGEAAEDAR